MSDQKIFTVDRDQIFQELDYSEQCSHLHCSRVALVGKHSHPVCDGSGPADCPRTDLLASEINRFIAENDDIFRYIK